MSDEKLALLAAEIEWYREKVKHVADALEGLGKRAAQVGNVHQAHAYRAAAQLTRKINEVER